MKKVKVESKKFNAENKCYELEIACEKLKYKINKMEKALRQYSEKATSEINVVEEDGSWGDYTGVFYCNEKDQEKVVIDKAKKHYETHFKDGAWYDKKTLGLFVTTQHGRKFVKMLKNKGNMPKEIE